MMANTPDPQPPQAACSCPPGMWHHAINCPVAPGEQQASRPDWSAPDPQPLDLVPLKTELSNARYRVLTGGRAGSPKWDDIETLVAEVERLRAEVDSQKFVINYQATQLEQAS